MSVSLEERQCLSAQAYLLPVPVLVTGAEGTTSSQRAWSWSVPIWTAAVWALMTVLRASPCSGVLGEAELMGWAWLRFPANRQQVDAMVLGGWDVVIPRGTMDHGAPRDHPVITRIWGNNSLNMQGSRKNSISFPHLCSFLPAQGYRGGFSALGFHLNECLLACPSGFGCPEVFCPLPWPIFLLSHEKPPATLLCSPHIILSSSYDLLWAASVSWESLTNT